MYRHCYVKYTGIKKRGDSMAFNGLGMSMGNLSRVSSAKSRSISAENLNGEAGRGGMATEGTGGIIRRSPLVSFGIGN
jgi:hypothetical protein